MKLKIDASKLVSLLLGVLLITSPIFGHAAESIKQWTISKSTADLYSTTITKKVEIVRIQFPPNIETQNTTVMVIRDLPETPLGIPSSSVASMGVVGALVYNSTYCNARGLDDNCRLDIKLLEEDYSLGAGDTLEIKVEFTEDVGGELKTFNKTGRFTRLKRGTFRLGVGALFVLSNSDSYLTRLEGDAYQVYRAPGDDLSLNLAATVTWVPYTAFSSRFPNLSYGPTIGVGTDADNLAVFLGFSGIYRRAWTLTGGIAAVKENKLNPQYEVGQIVPEAIDSSSLTASAYKARIFIGLTWTPSAK